MPNITGQLEDFLGTKLTHGQLLVEFYGTDARVDGSDVRLGPKRYELKDLPNPLTLDAGSYRFHFATAANDASPNGQRPKFTPQSFAFDLQADTTWGAIFTNAVPLPPEISDQATQILAQMEQIRDETEAISGLTGEDNAVAALLGSTTSAAAKRLPALSLRAFGAVLDGIADDTAAVQAAVAWIKAYSVTDPPLSRPRSVTGHGGIAKVTDTIDMTGINLGRGWAIRDLTIRSSATGKVAVDLTGSRFGRFPGFRVWGEQASQPHTGILLASGADQGTNPCSHFGFEDGSVDGYFTSSALHLNAAEENLFANCQFWNRRVADANGDAYAVILDGAGYKTTPAGSLARNATRASFTVNKFDKCSFQKPFAIAGPTMFMQDIASVSFESCYITAGSGTAIDWRLTNGFTPYRVYMDFQMETTGIDRFIRFTSDAAGAREVRGLHCTFGNMYADQEVFSVDTSVTSLALRSFRAHLYRLASGVTLANKLFDGESKVSIYGGDIVVPTATDFDTGFALLSDVKVTGMDGTTAVYETAWTAFTPTLTNWTLSNGTLTGAYRKTGRAVQYRIRYTVGSSDTPSGNFGVSLPFATNGGSSGAPRGTAHLFDTSASARRNRFATHLTTTSVQIADADYVLVGALTPWTWAAGDTIEIVGLYESAA